MGQLGNPSEVVRRLEAVGAQYLWVVYHNYSALSQAKVVARHRFKEVARSGVSFARANWDFAITDDQLPDAGFAAESGDFRVVPDPATVVPLEYRPGVAQAYGWLADDDGRPWVGDPRGRLQAQAQAFTRRGLAASMAFEAEFVLGVRTPDDDWAPSDHGRMFVVDEVDARWPWAARVLDAIDAVGIPVHQFAKEYGPAQYEISLMPADPVTAADRYLLMRQIVKALAREVGLVATFMPKPWPDLPSNGLHVHLSLTDGTGGPSIQDPSDPDELSPIGRGAVAGVLEHADGLCALTTPTSNSYRRLHPGSWAPAHRCWGFGNRAALVRIPGRGEGRHLEYRLADASANPYLLATGLLAAIGDGIDRRLAPPAPATVDVGHLSDAEAAAAGFERLPRNPLQALDALDSDAVLGDALGLVIREHYPRVKRFEVELSTSACDSVADPAGAASWERQAFLEAV